VGEQTLAGGSGVSPGVKVRFEPCQMWSAGSDPSAGACAECGWLEEDHWVADLERRVPATTS